MEPYFVNQTLPNETDSSFALTIPFTPAGTPERHNMTAWFAGTADENGVTVLREYRYPRQVNIYGPRQIEAQIDQDPDISQQITLWSQGGSEVIRGNMLVIPVNDAMLYVQPLYLKAAETTASSPRLARVIVAANDQVVMRPTLGEAIDALSDPEAQTVDQIQEDPETAVEEVSQGSTAEESATPAEGEETFDRSILPDDLAALSDQELADEALATLQRADEAQRNGEWQAYGEEMDRLETILQALAGDGSVAPAATPES